jgi:hypothetical protein
MKKTLTVCAVLMLIFSLFMGTVASAAEAPALTVSTVESAQAGDEVTVTVSLSGNPGISDMTLSLDYDETRLEFVGMVGEAFDANGGWTIGTNAVWSYSSADSNSSSNGKLLTITFQVKDGAPTGEASVTVQAEAYNIDEDPVTINEGTAKVAVEAAPCTEHKWDDGVVTTEATCTEEGKKTYTCANCGETKTETIAATGHSYASEVTQEATCTEEGVKTFICSKCDDTYTEAIAKIDHTPAEAKDGVKEATCTEDGYTGDTICSECQTVLTKGETIPATGHTKSETYMPDPETVIPATVNTPGTRYVKCTVCDELYPESFEASWSLTQDANIPASVLEKAGVSSVAELEAKMKPSDTSYTNIQVFEVTVKVDRGDNNDPTAAEGDDFPLTITLTYPETIAVAGNYNKYVYTVTHLKDDGTVEELKDVTITADGLVVTVDSLSPFAISWKDAPVPSSGNSNGSTAKGGNVPNTGDNSAIVLWAVMLSVCAMGAVTVVASNKKTSK